MIIFNYMGNILSRIQEIASKEGITIGSFERSIGASKGVLSRAITNGTDIQSKWVQIIADKYPQYSALWFLTGEGDMLANYDRQEILVDTAEEYHAKKNDCQGSPYFNVDFIGGFDVMINDQTSVPDYYIDYPPYNKDGVMWCNLTGDSMNPELKSGDVIALRELHTPVEYLPTGEIYGIVTDEYRTVKRMRLSDQKGYVRLIPSNKSDEYCVQEIPISMIRRVYAVLGSFSKHF